MKRGDLCTRQGQEGTFKVMAVADGYAMIRRPGCYPTVAPLKELTVAEPEGM